MGATTSFSEHWNRARSRLALSRSASTPGALAALGRDLVTDDVVAVMELVKNSYDALATRVDVRIRPTGNSPGGEGYIEVDDNGHGMDYDTVRDVWCVIATPSRAERPMAKCGSRTRAVTGEKGLGRLAAARLGNDIEVRTKRMGRPAPGVLPQLDRLIRNQERWRCWH